MRWLGRLTSCALLFACALSSASPSTTASIETERVVAFARLYGVVRYFHPSDAAQDIDWDRFAVYGVRRVRAATNARQLQKTLTELIAPLGTDIRIGPIDRITVSSTLDLSAGPLVAWRHQGLGLESGVGGGAYRSERTNRTAHAPLSGFTTLMQTVDARELRGSTVRLRALARASASDRRSGAALWLRVDRQSGEPGFFDNMAERPIRTAEWRTYEIVGTVDADAARLAFGLLASGAVQADFDAVELARQAADGAWQPIAIADAGFESEPVGWRRAGNASNAQIERRTDDTPQGAAWVRLSAPPRSATEFFSSPPDPAKREAQFALGAGLDARVSLVLTHRDAQVTRAQRRGMEALERRLARVEPEVASLDARQADVVVAWNVFRHFYPYWVDLEIDWDARLPHLLDSVREGTDRAAHLDALRRLVAGVQDGHGRVADTRERSRPAFLPVLVAPLDGGWVVAASDAPDRAQVGDVVEAVNGTPVREYIARAAGQASGSPQWREWRLVWDVCTGVRGSQVTLDLRRGEAPVRVELTYEASSLALERRPSSPSELQPGVWYVDLTRTQWKAIEPVLGQLAKVRAVIFDMRGYPTDAGRTVLPHLLQSPEEGRWMHIPRYVEPFGEPDEYMDIGWNLKPAEPHVQGRRIFLTDGRAISYAESVMGYVGDHRLGEIVGSATAGANGNITTFGVPTGYAITFTGMRVTRHDGSRFHLIGVRPSVELHPTLAGIRAGRDELLEKALELAQ